MRPTHRTSSTAAGMLAGASGFMGCAAAVIGSLWRARQNRPHHHLRLIALGAPSRDRRGRALPRGRRFPRSPRQPVSAPRWPGARHGLCADALQARAVGLVIPTLLSWTGSAVVHDIKGENWQLTAAGGAASPIACCSIRPIRVRPATIRSWKVRRDWTKFATSRTSPTSWSIPKGRSNAGVTGRRPVIACWLAPSCMVLYAEEEKRFARVANFPLRSHSAPSPTRCVG